VDMHACIHTHTHISMYLTAVTHVFQVDGVRNTLLCVIYPYCPFKCHLLHNLVAFCIFNFGVYIIWFCFGHLQETKAAASKKCVSLHSNDGHFNTSFKQCPGEREKISLSKVSWSPSWDLASCRIQSAAITTTL
jgi:hypothetical protein